MDLTTITIAQFQARFARDFTYGTDPVGNYVTNNDIQNAFNDAQMLLNQRLYNGTASITNAYLYLSAHCLCINLKAAAGGINGAGLNPVTGKSVGSVSQSFQVPEEYTKDATLARYTATSYGLTYLALSLPQTRGNMMAVAGGVQGNSDLGSGSGTPPWFGGS